MPATHMDMSRIWALLHQHLLPGEDGHCITIVGALLQPKTGLNGIRRLMESDARDVWMLSNQRVLLLRPKATVDLTLRDAFLLARGDLRRAGAFQDWPREALTDYEIGTTPPAGVSLMGDLRWLRLTVNGRETHTLLDDAANPAPELAGAIAQYVQGRAL